MAVLAVREDIPGHVLIGFLRCHHPEGHHNQFVAGLCLAGGSTVDADDAAPAFTGNDIGFKAFAVVVVHHEHFLVGSHPAGIHQIHIDGNTAGVVQFGLCNAYVVEFGEQNLNEHVRSGKAAKIPHKEWIRRIRTERCLHVWLEMAFLALP